MSLRLNSLEVYLLKVNRRMKLMFKNKSNLKKISTPSKSKLRLRKRFISPNLNNMFPTGKINFKNSKTCFLMFKHLQRKKHESIKSFVKSLRTWSINIDLISKS